MGNVRLLYHFVHRDDGFNELMIMSPMYWKSTYACYHFGKVVAYGLRELLSRNQE